MPIPTNTNHIKSLALEITHFLDETFISVEFLTQGSDKQVWHLKSNQNEYALRILSGRTSIELCAIEFQIRNKLANNHAKVAQPILISSEHPEITNKTDWVLDQYVKGSHPKRAALSPKTCADIGRSLAVLHGLKISGVGKPENIKHSVITACNNDPITALLTRFDNPLPVSGGDWKQHPIHAKRPDIIPRIQPYILEIRSELNKAQPVLCHSDLHERQMMCHDGELKALLDFDDMTIANPRWDFASLYYFHTSNTLDKTLNAYTNDKTMRSVLHNGAILFSLGIALHHASRSRLKGKEHRFMVACNHISKTLEKLEDGKQN